MKEIVALILVLIHGCATWTIYTTTIFDSNPIDLLIDTTALMPLNDTEYTLPFSTIFYDTTFTKIRIHREGYLELVGTFTVEIHVAEVMNDTFTVVHLGSFEDCGRNDSTKKLGDAIEFVDDRRCFVVRWTDGAGMAQVAFGPGGRVVMTSISLYASTYLEFVGNKWNIVSLNISQQNMTSELSVIFSNNIYRRKDIAQTRIIVSAIAAGILIILTIISVWFASYAFDKMYTIKMARHVKNSAMLTQLNKDTKTKRTPRSRTNSVVEIIQVAMGSSPSHEILGSDDSYSESTTS